MSKKRRIWNKEELTIAYYIAKWGYYGINTTEDIIVFNLIGNTSVKSFRMQVAKFQFLLGLSADVYCNPSKRVCDLVDELNNKTVSQVRKTIATYITNKNS